SVARVPVVGSVKAVASVRFRTDHTVAALNTLSKSIVASRVLLLKRNSLPARTSVLFHTVSRVLPSGSRLMIWLVANPTARLICRVIGGACLARMLPVRVTLGHGTRYMPGRLN